MHRGFFWLNSILIFSVAVHIAAQNYTYSAETAIPTGYTTVGIRDTVLIYSRDNADKYLQAGTGNGSLAVFEWWEYAPGTGAFNMILITDSSEVSTRTISENAGYRIIVSGEDIHDTAIFWAIINDLSVNIYNADEEIEGEDTIKIVPEEQKWCHLIRDINAEIDQGELRYYDPNTNTPVYLQSDHIVSWSASPDPDLSDVNQILENDALGLRIDIRNPYWEDCWYIITVTNAYGFSASDSVFYVTIEPHADFSYEYIRLDNQEYYPDRSDEYYNTFYGSDYDHTSAPALFRFENLSVNADTMIWYFGDDRIENAREDSILHTYALPGTYSPQLVVYNIVPHLYEACTDTFPKEDEDVVIDNVTYPIVIDAASITAELPNVFLPGGDPEYIRFKEDVSITDFEIAIYNRFGKRVYHYMGNIRDWEGWDGRVKNSDRYVSSGVYFYVVKEIKVLPDYSTGIKPKLIDPNAQTTQPADGGTGEDTRKVDPNTIYRGFIHVYNML